MITIQNGKLTIPEEERFIGFAGDNLLRKLEFLICGASQQNNIYRLYLTFDDGTVNYFSLPSSLTEAGVVLTWNVERKHIFKSGNVRAQIKSFSDAGVVYHTTSDTFFVGDSAEFSDFIKESNTEFLEYEEKLNNLKESIYDVCLLTPYIGNNGNWYIYDSTVGQYIDSGNPSVATADSMLIGNGSITSEKLAQGAINSESLFSEEMQELYLSLPVFKKTISDGVSENYYNTLTQQGIYRIDDTDGTHEVLIVLRPDSDSYLMQLLLKFNKVLYRGILCTGDGVYADEDWEEWTDLTDKGMPKAKNFYQATAIGSAYDPQLIAYQTSVPGMPEMLRIPLSVVRDKIMKIEDRGNYFVSETVEGALQELGAEVVGIAQLLAEI